MSKPVVHKPFGSQVLFCEPAWYQGQYTPYFHQGHVAYRQKVRDFVEAEIMLNIDEWIKTGYPRSLHTKAFQLGVTSIFAPTEYGGTKTKDIDAFYELIYVDEMARASGHVMGQIAIDSMALPPIIRFGSDFLKQKVCRPVFSGEKSICLCISEPGAGSDVANIQTSAKRNGDHYVVNGSKKWITGGLFGDFFTVAVRTGGEGLGGISLLLLEKSMPGITIRKMETQFDNAHSTTFITFDNVRVPVTHLIGEENQGALPLLVNFNHERWIIAAGAARAARVCYEESLMYAMKRKTFGKTLVSHQLIRYKLAEMARQIESLQDNVERIVYQFACGTPDHKMGAACALLKVQASKTFEYCAREASQIFGGAAIVREGQGKVVERQYRSVRASAIPGGSEEILLDFAIRQVAAKAAQLQSKM